MARISTHVPIEELEVALPYEIATLRPVNVTTKADRARTLEAAGYNTELIPQDAVYVDLKTDSGVGARNTTQVAEQLQGPMESAPELAPQAHASVGQLHRRFKELFGLPFMLACNQGRSAERIWCKLHVRSGSIVPGNMLFPSMRYHIASNGGKPTEIPCPEAYELSSDDPFKGNLDMDALHRLLKDVPDRVPFVCVELCNNTCGGHPVSLDHLTHLKEMLEPHRISLLLDASRILENSLLLKLREASLRDVSIPEIVRRTCATADALTLSAQKDFGVQGAGLIGLRNEETYQETLLQSFLDGVQPETSTMRALAAAMVEHLRTDAYTRVRVSQVTHLWKRLTRANVPVLRPAGGHAVYIDVARFLPEMRGDDNPAEALAAFVYLLSGVRIAKGPPPSQGQKDRGTNLLRMAVPPHRYLEGHLDHAAQAVIRAFELRDGIRGLCKQQHPTGGKYSPPLFTRPSS